MARPTNANAAETRERILAAAVRLFAAQGAQGSARAVARAAKVSLATVHYYFGSKEGLFQACVDSMDTAFTTLHAELVGIPAEGGTLDEMLEKAVRRGFRFALTHRLAIRLVTRTAIDRGQIEPRRQAEQLIPGLENGVALLGQLTGAPAEGIRLTIRSMTYLIVRYALTERRELAMALGWDPDDFDEVACERAVEDHLVFSARTLLAGLSGGNE